MSTSKTNSNLNESLDLDEIEQSLTNNETSSSVQQTDPNRFPSANHVVKQTKIKTSNVPGPVGLLPILKTQEDLKRLKEDKSARDALMNTEENRQVKRTKGSNDLFSLNIDNYPSYAIALKQLNESFNCEPISIQTALVKARLGIKKRIPLMCAAVTHYDRHENTILIDKSGNIRATFIGDDESLDNFNIRVGNTLVLRNVAVFTSTRHRHQYVNIHLQNIIAIQDPLMECFTLPSTSQDRPLNKSDLCAIGHELSTYEDTSKTENESFHIFSPSESNGSEKAPLKKINNISKGKSSSSSGFTHIQAKENSLTTSNRFPVDQSEKSTTKKSFIPPVTTSNTKEVDLLKIVDKPLDVELNSDAMNNLISEIDNDEFFSTW